MEKGSKTERVKRERETHTLAKPVGGMVWVGQLNNCSGF